MPGLLDQQQQGGLLNALSLLPYLDPMQPVHMAQGILHQAKNAFMAPGQAYNQGMSQDEMIKRGMDLATLMPGARD